jgi:hypothetical protein
MFGAHFTLLALPRLGAQVPTGSGAFEWVIAANSKHPERLASQFEPEQARALIACFLRREE